MASSTTGTIASLAGAVLCIALGCTAPPPPPEEQRREPRPLAAPVLDRLEQAKRDTACTDAAMLAGAVEQHLLAKGSCPASVEALVETGMIARVPASQSQWKLRCEKDGPVVRAPGADGRLDTDDDIVHDATGGTCRSR